MDKQIHDAVCVASFRLRAEAEMIQGMLKSEHIPSFISGDDAGGMYPPLTNGIMVYVAAKDKKKALEVLHI